jgi:hypothetical protein
MLSNQSINQTINLFYFRNIGGTFPLSPTYGSKPLIPTFSCDRAYYKRLNCCCLNQKTYSTLLVLYLNTIGALPERSGEMPLASGLNFLPEYFWHGLPELF